MRWTIVLGVLAACGGDKLGRSEDPVFEVDVVDDGGPPDEAAPDADGGLAVPPDDAGAADDAAAGEGEDEGDAPADCPCVEDTIRYCDAPAYCAWGAQICEVSGGIHRWSGCEEEAIPPGCDPWGALAAAYEWHYAGGYWDGRVDDADGDGVLDSEPDWWLNPAGQDCAMRAGLCVQDAWDLDLDGDIEESVGNCQVEECP